jgi:sugar lactone lactonase YvrE
MRTATLVAVLAIFTSSSSCEDKSTKAGVEDPSSPGAAGSGRTQIQGSAPPALPPAPTSNLPQQQPVGRLDVVATFDRWMPTGIAVSREGRVFASFPHFADPIEFSVGEVKNGRPVPYPDAEWNRAKPDQPAAAFISVQSVVIDPKNRLWALDTGSVNFGNVKPGGAKLVGFDIATGKPLTTIIFPADVVLARSYTDDVRFDLKRGKAGMAFITDSSSSGPNGIIVVDLDSKRSWRKLTDHPSTKPAPGFLGIVEGGPLYHTQAGVGRKAFVAGADGIAVSVDGKWLYYSPLGSRHLYSASLDALADEKRSDADVAKTVQDLGDKGASDGLEMDAQNRLYMTEYENDAILRRMPDGTIETIASDPRLVWPDSLALGVDGYLYVTVNQLDRQPMFHDGKDMRQPPYVVYRVKTDGSPIRVP